MITLLKLLIFGHLHKWVTIKENPFERREFLRGDAPTVTHQGTKYTCRCEKCGQIKAFTP